MSTLITLENKYLKVQVSSLGAELQSVKNRTLQIEYIWQADPEFWARKSPVLFPIVGKLQNNQYQLNGENYQMNQHGFARNEEFKVKSQTDQKVVFELKESKETLKMYPYKFNLQISYLLEEQNLSIQYQVKNTQKTEMYFSIGAHPAFNVPLFPGESYKDYFLEFNHSESAERYLIEDGLITKNTQSVFYHPTKLDLFKALFYNDALVFKQLKSNVLKIKSKLHAHGLSIEANDFPYYGIWAQKDADFVCLEPWCGIADEKNKKLDFSEKEGINRLAPAEEFKRTISLKFF